MVEPRCGRGTGRASLTSKLSRFVSALTILATAAFGEAIGPSEARAASSGPKPEAGIRLLVPNGSFAQTFETSLKAVVLEWNHAHAQDSPSSRITIIRAGDDFSSARILVARHLAGNAPELALIDPIEAEAVARSGAAQNPPSVPHLQPMSQAKSLPLFRTAPVLIANTEMLTRSVKLPTTWSALRALAQSLRAQQERPLATPLRGARGLWMFEAWAGKTLWKREAGGLQSNRELLGEIQLLQNWIDQGVLAPEQTWDQALQAFLDRKSPLLVASSDALAAVQARASFSWTAAPLVSATGGIGLAGGSDLVVTRRSAQIDAFVAYLYSPTALPRLLAAGGFLIPSPHLLDQPQWKAAWKAATSQAGPQGPTSYRDLAEKLARQAAQPLRTSDRDVVRAHTEWIRALRALFGPAPRSVPASTILTQIDQRLSSME